MPDHPLSDMNEIMTAFSVEDYLYFHIDYLTAERSELETEGAIELLSMTPPMKILDLACGFGRIANRLAIRGYQVTGIDYLPGFLDLARSGAQDLGVTVDYIRGDIRQIEYSNEYDRIILMFNSFGYFNDRENLLILKNIAQSLKIGGKVGFDIANRDGVLNNFHSHYVSEKEGNFLINRFSFDVWTGRLENDRIVIRNGKRIPRPFSIRLYNLSEIRSLLNTAGLELENVYAEWDGQSFTFDSPAMVIIAGKS